MGLAWWLTERGVFVRDDLARMLIENLKSGTADWQFVAKSIERTLQQNGDNTAILEAHWFTRHATLFDGRAENESQFGEALLSLIEEDLSSAITEWLVVVPFPKILMKSREIGYDELVLLSAKDVALWQRLGANFQYTSQWDPCTGVGGANEPRLTGGFEPQTWRVCRPIGSQPTAAQAAIDRIRTFVAVLFAVAYSTAPHFRYRMAASPPRHYVQFASERSRGDTGRALVVVEPPLVPITGGTIDSEGIIDQAQSWYTKRASAAADIQRRATVASQFLQYGLVSSGIQQFFHFFITLDALFGVQGSFEESILSGIKRVLKADRQWLARARKLIKLRNELVHGGSSSISTWPLYDDYVRHFRTEPLSDAAVIATTALRDFFEP